MKSSTILPHNPIFSVSKLITQESLTRRLGGIDLISRPFTLKESQIYLGFSTASSSQSKLKKLITQKDQKNRKYL